MLYIFLKVLWYNIDYINVSIFEHKFLIENKGGNR